MAAYLYLVFCTLYLAWLPICSSLQSCLPSVLRPFSPASLKSCIPSILPPLNRLFNLVSCFLCCYLCFNYVKVDPELFIAYKIQSHYFCIAFCSDWFFVSASIWQSSVQLGKICTGNFVHGFREDSSHGL